MLVFVSVQQWNISTDWTDISFCTNINDPQMMNRSCSATSSFTFLYLFCFATNQWLYLFFYFLFCSCCFSELVKFIRICFVYMLVLSFVGYCMKLNKVAAPHHRTEIQSKNPDGNNSCSLKRGNDFHDGCLRRCLITWESSVSSVSHFIRAEIFYIFTLYNKGI